MISSFNRRKIYLALHKADFRKGHNGLLAEAYALGLDPYKGDILIFVGRPKRKIKIIYSDDTGLWVSSKRFTVEAMKTKLKFLLDPSCCRITPAELAMIMEGSSYQMGSKVNSYFHDGGFSK
jgi:hypothetical protein